MQWHDAAPRRQVVRCDGWTGRDYGIYDMDIGDDKFVRATRSTVGEREYRSRVIDHDGMFPWIAARKMLRW